MDKTIELVNSVKDIQAMPSVIVKVLNLMKKPTVSMKELGDIVVFDQSLTVKILALVNSAYYGFSQQISSINIAMSLLGMVKVKNIIVAVAMKPMMSSAGDKELWKHSIRVATGCEYLAKLTKIMDSDEAFISGFIHDIGKIVLSINNPKMYTRVIDITNQNNLLAKRWQLPILLANIISYHHNPALSSIPVPCNLVCLVDKLTQENFNLNSLDKNFIKTMGIDIEDIEDLRQTIRQKAELMISELA